MPQIKLPLIAVLIAAGLALGGCGDKNSKAITPSGSGENTHPADWVQKHWIEFRLTAPQLPKRAGKVAAATVDLSNSSCISCHGADLKGGISVVSCFSASIGAQTCHAGGPAAGHGMDFETSGNLHGRQGAMAAPAVSTGFAYCAGCHGSNFQDGAATSCYYCHNTAPHPPKPWHGTTPSGSNHIYTDPANADQCAKCHTGGNNSDLKPASVVTAAPGCFNNTLCHGTLHLASWNNPTSPDFHSAAARAGISGCAGCHGQNLEGSTTLQGVPISIPACMTCHTGGNPTGVKATGCTSCHGGLPKGPDASLAPNRNSGHAKHTGLPGVTSCSACHNGYGTGTLNHGAGVPARVAFMTLFYSKGITGNPVNSAYDSSNHNCANVSCHGGKITPAWNQSMQSFASALPNGTCDACHQQGTSAYNPQNNSYYSGYRSTGGAESLSGNNEHYRHLPGGAHAQAGGVNITCTDCHDKTALDNQVTHFSAITFRPFTFTAPGATIGGAAAALPGVQGVKLKASQYNQLKQTCFNVSCHIVNNVNYLWDSRNQ